MRRPCSRPYRTWLGCCSPDRQAGQFSRTHGLRRKLSEPRTAGQSPAASLCSQRTTSDGDSNRASFMSSCAIYHTYSQEKSSAKTLQKPAYLRANLYFATETSLVSVAKYLE